MSRSKRKTPMRGITCCKSEKPEKKAWHRRFRAWCKQKLHKGEDLGNKDHRNVSNPWAMGKDGKYYDLGWNDKELRK